MKVYADLVVRGTKARLEEFLAALERPLAAGWTRNLAREADIRTAALGNLYCFACTATDSRPACELWVATNSEGNLYVSNILAQEFSSLTHDQYYAILRDFYENCVRPAAATAGVETELGNPDPQLEDFVSAGTADLLRSFSALANRSMLHPLDRKRWNEFLSAADREDARLPASMLQRWLIEEEKWPEDEAISLAIEYEHARDLLKVYSSQQA